MDEQKDRKEVVKKLLRNLPTDQVSVLLEFLLDRVDSALDRFVPPAIDQALQKVGYTDEIVGLVSLLAAKSNETKEEVLRKALTFYGLALDEREKGNRVAFLNSDDEIVREVVGFEPAVQVQ